MVVCHPSKVEMPVRFWYPAQVKKDSFKFYYLLSLVGQVGWTVSLPLVIFVLLGVFADKQFGTKPALTLAGLMMGMIISFYSLYQFLKPILKPKKLNKPF